MFDVLSKIVVVLTDHVDGVTYEDWPPRPIDDNSLEVLIARFQTLKFKFDVTGESPMVSGILRVIEDSLVEIKQQNSTLKFVIARMKESGEQEANRIKTACDRFFNAHEEWVKWYSSDSPL